LTALREKLFPILAILLVLTQIATAALAKQIIDGAPFEGVVISPRPNFLAVPLEMGTVDQGRVDEFFAAAILTTDSMDEIERKWDTPPEVVPHFNAPEVIRPSEIVTLLIFYSQATVMNGSINLICDADIFSQGQRIEPDPERGSCFSEIQSVSSAEGPRTPEPRYIKIVNYSTGFSFPNFKKLPQNVMFRVRVTDANINKSVFLEVNVKVADR